MYRDDKTSAEEGGRFQIEQSGSGVSGDHVIHIQALTNDKVENDNKIR